MTNREHLQQCTVRLNINNSQGTGFFVAPRLVLTVAHVVGKHEAIAVFWKHTNQTYQAKIKPPIFDYPIDLALLQLEGNIPDHPCVCLDSCDPGINELLYIFGYPKGEGLDYSDGDSATFNYEGESFKKDVLLHKLKQGQVIEGFSGSPVLNLRTGKVCSIVNLSRDTSSNLGGRAVSVKVILAQFPELVELNRNFHQQEQEINKGMNPFEYGAPVPPDRFYGRRKQILEVKSRIGAISPQCVNIVGLRRNGKTSLLHYIKARNEEFFQFGQKPLIIDLDLTNAKFHTPEDIMEGLRRGIKNQTGSEPWTMESNNDGFDVEDGLQRLVDDGYRLIIMLDEFEAISYRLELFQTWGDDWRSKACAGLLTMVIASKRPLHEVYKTLGLCSPFSNIFSLCILGDLEVKEWQKLIDDKLGYFYSYLGSKEDIKNWIDELAGGLPFYVQMAGSMLWQYRDFEEAKKEFIFQSRPRFQELWKDLTEGERHALKYAAGVAGLASPNRGIIDMLKRHGLWRGDRGLFSSAFAEFVREMK